MAKYDEGFYRSIGDEGVVTASVVVPLLRELLGPLDRVLDLGCGVGSWLSVFAAHGATRVHGVDGDWVPRDQLRIAPVAFESADLVDWSPSSDYDLAVSLEVAEHLPTSHAETFVVALTDAAPVVLFSAAVPGQGGTGHVNEQWPSWWAAHFARRGYDAIDAIRPVIWSRDETSSCIAQNVLLFARRSLIESSPALQEARAVTRDDQLDVVHPRRYLLVADAEEMSLRRALESLPGAARGTVRRRLGRDQHRTRH